MLEKKSEICNGNANTAQKSAPTDDGHLDPLFIYLIFFTVLVVVLVVGFVLFCKFAAHKVPFLNRPMDSTYSTRHPRNRNNRLMRNGRHQNNISRAPSTSHRDTTAAFRSNNSHYSDNSSTDSICSHSLSSVSSISYDGNAPSIYNRSGNDEDGVMQKVDTLPMNELRY